jgi:hypothetical protein
LFHDDPRLILRDDDVVELRPDESVLRPLEESEYVVVDVEWPFAREFSLCWKRSRIRLCRW